MDAGVELRCEDRGAVIHLLLWYFKDQWISGYVCGCYVMFLGRLIVDTIWPRSKVR